MLPLTIILEINNRKMKHFCLVLTSLILLSCGGDILNITVHGTIKNLDTDKPIKGADVTIICWKYGDTPDQSYTDEETKTVISDGNGKYSVEFDKGAYVEVKASSYGYIDGHVSEEIYQKDTSIDVSLRVSKQ